MLLLLQETLEYIEKQFKFLEELNLVTTSSKEKYRQLHLEITNGILNFLDYIQKEAIIPIKSEPVEYNLVNTTSKTDGGGGELTRRAIIHDCMNKMFEYKPMSKISKTMVNLSNLEIMCEQTTNRSSCPANANSNRLISPKTTRDGFDSLDDMHPKDKASSNRNAETKCELCDKVFIRTAHLTSHMLVHNGEKPFKCEICKKCFARKCNMLKHVKTHCKDAPYKCGLCGLTFKQAHSLQHHIRANHTEKQTYKCEVCNKEVSRKLSLRHHMASHGNGPHFKCDICGRKYLNKLSLMTHKRERKTPMECNICKMKFCLKKDYRLHHVMKHSDKPFFTCETCDKHFMSKVAMLRHKLIHTGEKLFKCEICNTRFVRKDSVLLHIRKYHTSMK